MRTLCFDLDFAVQTNAAEFVDTVVSLMVILRLLIFLFDNEHLVIHMNDIG